MAFNRLFAVTLSCFILFNLTFAEDSDVVTLTKSNFDDIISKEKLVMVKFFAPWCGHCQAMADDFKKAATELKGKAVLADVDATVEEDLAKKYNIEGFPTLKVFTDGEELTDYNGGRDKESMIKFIERATLPAFTTIESKEAYNKFLSEHPEKHILVGVGLDAKQTADFKKSTFTLRDIIPDGIEFLVSEDPANIDIEGASKGDIYLARLEEDGSRKSVKYDSAAGESILKFVKSYALPVWQEFTQENAELYTELTTPIIVGFFKDCKDDMCKIMEKIAKKKKDNGKVTFAWVNSETLSSFQDYVGLKNAEIPICGYAFESDLRFLLPEGTKFSEKVYEAWVDDMISGKVQPTRKSQPIPDENDGPVYTVVGDSWSEIVEDTEKDVMIAQVAEWCGHCNALKPIYKKVAEELKEAGIDHVKLAMMDATENDAPDEYKARGFPTVHFFPAGKDQKGIEYDSDRSSKAIIEWIKEKTSKKFEFDTSTLGEDPKPAEDEEDMSEQDPEDEDAGDDMDEEGGDEVPEEEIEQAMEDADKQAEKEEL